MNKVAAEKLSRDLWEKSLTVFEKLSKMYVHTVKLLGSLLLTKNAERVFTKESASNCSYVINV